jgi:ribonuclease-3
LSRPAALEKRLGHRFAALELLQQALTHRSYGPQNNERLEFLGDGVLGCAVADELYARFPQLPEGKLTQLRASLVRKEALAEVGEQLGLAEFLHIGRLNAGTTASILADTVEAVFGAIFLDGGYVAARMSVVKAFEPLFARLDAHMPKDAKTRLQEIMHERKQPLPEYRVVGEHGQAHARTFEVECVVGIGFSTKGSGTSRQRAEQQAARAMLERLSK